MIIKKIQNFNISQICDSGQCFRMSQRENGNYAVIASDRYLEVRQENENICFFCKEAEFEEFWRKYFDLDADYAFYISQIDPADAYLNKAAGYGAGMRILRQDLWETLVSFLVSQQNTIIRIRKCIQNLCRHYGEERQNFRGETYYTFPKPKALAGLEDNALKECNLGYRSKYVVRAAKAIAEGQINLDKIAEMPYEIARKNLLSLYGVGEKVADCICLFALHDLQAFPIDTHIRQAIDKYYRQGFPKEQYRGYEGVLQQYIFYYEVMGGTQS